MDSIRRLEPIPYIVHPSASRSHPRMRLLRSTIASLMIPGLLGGCGYAHVNRDTANRPERSTGSAARVVMPGEPMPAMDEPLSTSEPVMIGGSSGESDRSTRDRDVPFGPLAVLFGYPFWIFGKSVSEEADEAETAREVEEQARRGEQTARNASRKRAQQERLEQENARMREALRRSNTDSRVATPSRPVAETTAGPVSVSPDSVSSDSGSSDSTAAAPLGAGAGLELQRELAALRRSLERRRSRTETAPPDPAVETRLGTSPQTSASSVTSPETLSERSMGRQSTLDNLSVPEDRDGDGRPDRWLERDASGTQREALDENRDGRADVVRSFDTEGRLISSEEDLDFDGRFEVTTQYRDGQPGRRLEDTDGNGRPDRWTYYQAGQIQRIESDLDGDGFRDRVDLFRGGELVETQQDKDGDGQPDRLERFARGETTEVHEDLDGDGKLDVASFYEAGKLVRRELRSEEVLSRWSGGGLEPVRGAAPSPKSSSQSESAPAPTEVP